LGVLLRGIITGFGDVLIPDGMAYGFARRCYLCMGLRATPSVFYNQLGFNKIDLFYFALK